MVGQRAGHMAMRVDPLVAVENAALIYLRQIE
jgi:hypothetical protein